MNEYFRVLVFIPSVQVSPVFHITSTTLLGFLAHTLRPCPSSFALNPILRSFGCLHPCCRSRSIPFPINVHFPVPASDPVPFFVSVPDLIPPRNPFASSPTSHPVTPSVQCACIDPGSCERNFWVPASATPTCSDDDACELKMTDRVYKSCAVSCAYSPLLHPP